jgi:hypothetical protein
MISFNSQKKTKCLPCSAPKSIPRSRLTMTGISQEHFAKRYFPPADMSFAQSEALFSSADLGSALGWSPVLW